MEKRGGERSFEVGDPMRPPEPAKKAKAKKVPAEGTKSPKGAKPPFAKKPAPKPPRPQPWPELVTADGITTEAPRAGFECKVCGCRVFPVKRTRRTSNGVIRYRYCHNCGKSKTTVEREVGANKGVKREET